MRRRNKCNFIFPKISKMLTPSKAKEQNRKYDDLSAVLNGTKNYRMDPVKEWFRTTKWWEYQEDKSLDQPVEIEGKLTEDFDLFFNVKDLSDTFDFKQTKWQEISDLAKQVFNSDDDETSMDVE